MAATSELSRVGIYPGSCSPEDALQLRNLTGRVVLQGRDGLRTARALARAGETDGVQVDPATYRDEPPKIEYADCLPGLEDVRVDWVQQQRALGLSPVYTAASRIRAGRTDELARYLEEQAGSADEVCVVALDSAWLTAKYFGPLTSRLAESGLTRFAIVLGDLFDPLGDAHKVMHLRSLLTWSEEAGVTLDLLRTDMSGLRAVLSGARFGGIGLSTSTRHLGLPFARKQRDDYERRKRIPLVFVPKLMHWIRANHLGALSAWPDHPLLQCSCLPCLSSADSSLARFDQVDLDGDSLRKLRMHDAWAMTSVVEKVMGASEPSSVLLDLQNSAIELALATTVDTKVEITLPPWFEHWQ